MVNHYLQVGVDVDASSLAIKKKNILSSSLNGTLPFIQNNGDFNITTSLNSIQKIAKIYVPIVTKQLSNLQVPAMSGTNGGIKWSTSSTKINNIHLNSNNVMINIIPNVGISISLKDINLSIPSTSFEVSKRVIINLHCGGYFSGTLSRTSVTVVLNITRDQSGTPVVTPTSKWSWGNININEKLDHLTCRVIQDIAKLFTGSITNKIQNAIENAVPPAFNNVIMKQGNQALQQLTKPINVDNYASLDLSLATNPLFDENSFQLSMLGIWGPPIPFINDESKKG